jgi:hypothetical protein
MLDGWPDSFRFGQSAVENCGRRIAEVEVAGLDQLALNANRSLTVLMLVTATESTGANDTVETRCHSHVQVVRLCGLRLLRRNLPGKGTERVSNT